MIMLKNKQKLTKNIMLSLALGTALSLVNVTGAATYNYIDIDYSGNGTSGSYQYGAVTGLTYNSAGILTNYTNTLTIADVQGGNISLSAQNSTSDYTNSILVYSQGRNSLDLSDVAVFAADGTNAAGTANAGKIIMQGDNNNITVGPYISSIDMNGHKYTNSIKVINGGNAHLNIERAKNVTVEGSTVGIIYDTGDATNPGTVTIGANSTSGRIQYTYGDVTAAAKAITGDIVNTTGNVTLTGSTSGAVSGTSGKVIVQSGGVISSATNMGISLTGDSVTVDAASVTSISVASDGIFLTRNDVTVKNGSTIQAGDGYGINYTGWTIPNFVLTPTGGSVTLSGASTVIGSKGGIYHTSGNVVVTGNATNPAIVTGTTEDGIAYTTGNVKLENAKVTGGTNGISATTGSVSLTDTTVTGTTGAGIKDVAGKVSLYTTEIYSQAGSGLVTDEGTRTTANTNSVYIEDTKVTGNGGDGINAKYRTDVTLNKVTVTAQNNGVIAGDPTGSAKGILHITTDPSGTAVYTFTVGNSGIVAYNDTVTVAGNTKLTINLTSNGTTDDVHADAAYKMLDGSKLINPTVANDIVIHANDSASGLIAKGTNAEITLTDKNHPVNISSDVAAVNVDGIYTANDGKVDMEAGSILLKGTGEVNGIHAIAQDLTTADKETGTAASAVTVKNLGAGFSVAATGTGAATGVKADGTGTTVLMSGTDLDKITSVNGAATGLAASNAAVINTTFDANNTFRKIKVEATGTGDAVAINAASGAKITSLNVENITALADKTGTAWGIKADGTDSSVIVNEETAVNMGALTVTSKNGSAYGLDAENGAANSIYGLTTVEVSGNADKTTGEIAGVMANGANSSNNLTMNGAITITAGTGRASGVIGLGQSTNKVTGVTGITATSTVSGDALGIYAQDSTNTITGTNAAVSATAVSGEVDGIVAESRGAGAAQNTVTGITSVTVNGSTFAYGIGALGYNDTTTAKTLTAKNDVTMNGAISATSTAAGLAAGIGANVYGTNIVRTVTDITASGVNGFAYGIGAADHSSNTVTMSGNLSAELTKSGNVYGVLGSLASTNTITMQGTITAAGGDTTTADNVITAINASYNSTDTITGVTSLRARSAGAGAVNGIVADTNGTVKVYQADGTSQVAVTAESTGSGTVTGVKATGNSTIENISDVTATADSGYVHGVILGSGTNTIKTLNNIKATTSSGYSAYGVYADGATKDEDVNTLAVAGSITVTNTTGEKAGGVYNNGSKILTVTVTKDVTAAAPAGVSYVARSEAADATTDVTVAGTMSATGAIAKLARAAAGDTLTLTGNGTAILQGTAIARVADVDGQSTINLKNITVKAEGPTAKSYAAYSNDGGGTVNLISTIITGNNVNGGAEIYYDNSFSKDGSDLNVTIDNASSITGAANAEDTYSSDEGAINITNAGTWNVTGDSNLNLTGNSKLANTGLIDMTKDGSTDTAITSSTIFVHGLEHGGNLIMDVSPENIATGDRLVTNTAAGSGRIKANILDKEIDASKQAALENPANPLIAVADSDASNYIVTNNGNNRLEVGNWVYQLEKYTYTNPATGEPVKGYRLGNTNHLSNKGKTVVSSVISPDYWYYETNALYTDINDFNGARKDHDVWAHAVHNKVTLSESYSGMGAASQDIDTQYSGMVVGIDKKFSQTAKGSFWGGIMGGYGKSSNDFAGGNADSDSAHVGVYGVYRTNTDWYVGGILKYNRYGTDIKTDTTAGSVASVHSSDSMDQHGYGISIIGGKRFTNNRGWFVEPQLEFGYHKIGEGDYNLHNMHVNVDAMTSKRLRAGFNFGKSISYQSGAKLDVFGQISLLHEFNGQSQITTKNTASGSENSDTFAKDFGGSWGRFKLGLNYSTARSSNAILALTYDKGSHRSSPLGIEAKFNWSF